MDILERSDIVRLDVKLVHVNYTLEAPILWLIIELLTMTEIH